MDRDRLLVVLAATWLSGMLTGYAAFVVVNAAAGRL